MGAKETKFYLESFHVRKFLCAKTASWDLSKYMYLENESKSSQTNDDAS
jgi:hypothetical protein